MGFPSLLKLLSCLLPGDIEVECLKAFKCASREADVALLEVHPLVQLHRVHEALPTAQFHGLKGLDDDLPARQPKRKPLDAYRKALKRCSSVLKRHVTSILVYIVKNYIYISCCGPLLSFMRLSGLKVSFCLTSAPGMALDVRRQRGKHSAELPRNTSPR